jgi:hypothetical protein
MLQQKADAAPLRKQRRKPRNAITAGVYLTRVPPPEQESPYHFVGEHGSVPAGEEHKVEEREAACFRPSCSSETSVTSREQSKNDENGWGSGGSA